MAASSFSLLTQSKHLDQLKTTHAGELQAHVERLQREVHESMRREKRLEANFQTEKERADLLQRQVDQERAAGLLASKRSEQELRRRDEAAATRAASSTAKQRMVTDQLKRCDELLRQRDAEIRSLQGEVQVLRRRLHSVNLQKEQSSFIEAQRASSSAGSQGRPASEATIKLECTSDLQNVAPQQNMAPQGKQVSRGAVGLVQEDDLFEAQEKFKEQLKKNAFNNAHLESFGAQSIGKHSTARTGSGGRVAPG